MYSQNNEEQVINDYFNGLKGTLLDLGANDGKTFSNSLKLIEKGWGAVLVDASPVAFDKLCKLHSVNNKVLCFNYAIGNSKGKVLLKESGSHLKDKSDVSLLSSIDEQETTRWKKAGVVFNDVEVDMISYLDLCKIAGINEFDFITIDCEGLDLDILKQIDLTNTSLICIEWNSDETIKTEITNYCKKFGLNKLIYTSAENIIIGK
jgi:FkbM family methyltransferase